ncbi:nuclear hormone receptor HR96-like isoform X2 [Liolophura sinensis]
MDDPEDGMLCDTPPLIQIKQEVTEEMMMADMLPTHTKRKIKCKEDKICKVCGDTALGYNFDAITCESCKAFFRRNATREKKMKCLFQGNCDITVKTRRFCPHCRLMKCFNMGMKKDMILDETERKARMEKVTQNRQKRAKRVSCQSLPDTDILDTSDVAYSPPSTSTGSPTMTTYASDKSVSSYHQGSSHTVHPVSNAALPADPLLYRQLTSSESVLLDELKVMYETTLGSFHYDSYFGESENYANVNQLVNNSEVCVRKLIKFVKKLEDFRMLSQEDQITALKACVLNTLLLRSVFFYSIEKDAWLTPSGDIPTDILKKATGFHNLHDSHIQYCKTVKSLVRDNLKILGVLQVVIVFNPDGQGITHREAVADIQDKYVILLKHYLESEFSYSHAKELHPQLLLKIAELKGLSEEHAKVLLQVNPHQIEPLLLEIFNLKM